MRDYRAIQPHSIGDYKNCSRLTNSAMGDRYMAKAADKCRTGIPGVAGLGKVVNSNAWGDAKATERYGGGTKTFAPPKDVHAPQKLGDGNNLQGPNYRNMTSNDWRRGNGMKPTFVPGYHGKK